ncbi:MAG TPA: PorP/SprF family type IX secretion system membrane protein [Bacteroidia bacterium]|jgi:type IX secretion system PorP/SprF family membrane protein|nr:PorP/SprF family type IX secretion system membrane protein [Bacteroidia bacterium]
MKKIISVLFTLCIVAQLAAQDIHLSQFYASDHLLNPAKIGDFDGDYRFTANYRNQWRQVNSNPLNTYIVSFDKALHYYSHELDCGVMVARDEFTAYGVTTTKILLSGAYGYTTETGHNFRVGIQPGLVFRDSKISGQTFPSQWDYDQGDFIKDLPNNEKSLNANLTQFDLDLGVQWSKNYTKATPKIGFAVDHLNMPKDTYFNEVKDRLRIRKVFHAELDYRTNEKLTLQPKLLWQWTAKANDLVVGANAKYKLPNKTITSVFAGAYYRSGAVRIADAVIPVVGLSIKQFDLGFSYDVNISTLSTDVKSRRSTFEVSLIYTGASLKPKIKTLPCDRY